MLVDAGAALSATDKVRLRSAAALRQLVPGVRGERTRLAGWWSPLREAAAASAAQLGAVSCGFDHRAPLTALRSQDGRASLHLAAYQGHLELVKLLLTKGANVTATTAVRPHAYPGRCRAAAGAPAASPGRARGSGLACVVRSRCAAPARRSRGRPVCVCALRLRPLAGGLDRAARRCGQGPLGGGQAAARLRRQPGREGQGACARRGGAWLRATLTRVSPAQHGRTALHAASEKGHLEVAKVLLANAADIKAQDKVRLQLPRTAASPGPLARACRPVSRCSIAIGID